MAEEPFPITFAGRMMAGTDAAATNIKQGVDNVVSDVRNDVANKAKIVESTVEGLRRTLEPAAQSFGEAIVKIPQDLMGNVDFIFKKGNEFLQSGIQGITQMAQSGFNAAGSAVDTVASGVNQTVATVGQGVSNIPAPPAPPKPPAPPRLGGS